MTLYIKANARIASAWIYINGPIERKGGYQTEEGEKTEVRRCTVRVGDRGGNCARREKKKEVEEEEETLQK